MFERIHAGGGVHPSSQLRTHPLRPMVRGAKSHRGNHGNRLSEGSKLAFCSCVGNRRRSARYFVAGHVLLNRQRRDHLQLLKQRLCTQVI